PAWRADVLAGFRYLGLREDLRVDSATMALVPGLLTLAGQPVNPGTLLATRDQFLTSNDFYGGQLGGRLAFAAERFGFDLTAKAALGVNQQFVNIRGSTSAGNPGGGATTVAGGVLAVSSNSGRFYRND